LGYALAVYTSLRVCNVQIFFSRFSE
jgi:hypothetical protein